MWFRPVKELFHPFDYMMRHTLKPGMLNPVLASVSSKWILHQAVVSDAFG
jgi:hypothetical protein